jgi:chemotaxis protein methyltransferase CheR
MITAAEFKLYQGYIARHCGIALGGEKIYLVDTRLRELLDETGSADFGSLYRLAVNDTSNQLRNRIVDAMTTNERLWFRDEHPFTILKEKLIPELAAQLRAGGRSRIRIWSAACSTGQEPYSIAMVVRDLCRTQSGLRPEHVEILASDISPTALSIAQAGRYDENSLKRGLPDELKSRYFRQDGPVRVVDDEIKRMVTFQKFNLQDVLDIRGRFDIVFCRYVAIYFSEDFKRTLYQGLARALEPGGYLLISAVENLREVCRDFEPLEYASGVCYRRT